MSAGTDKAKTAKSARKISIPGEVGLILGLLTDAIGVSFILKAEFGLSPVVSVQYALSQTFDFISYGTWSYLTQAAALVVLLAVIRRFQPVYLFSMLMAVGFGYLIDLFNFLIRDLPMDFLLRTVYFAFGFFIVSLGIALFMLCKMPLLPIELMIREITEYKGIQLRRFKTVMDIGCVISAALITFAAFGFVKGLGAGTLISAFFMGCMTQLIRDLLNRFFEFGTIEDSASREIKEGKKDELL